MNNIDLGRRIKQRRTDLGLTQGDIAAEVGVAISTIQRYETGSIERVKLPVVEAIARALHVDLDWLVGKTPEREEVMFLQAPTYTTFTLKQARQYAGLTQQALAERLGIDRSTYIRLEQDASRATVAQIVRIAKETGISPQNLLLQIDPV